MYINEGLQRIPSIVESKKHDITTLFPWYVFVKGVRVRDRQVRWVDIKSSP